MPEHQEGFMATECFQPIAILWDMQNCAVPREMDAEEVAVNIRRALRVQLAMKGPITMFSAYADFAHLPHRTRHGCQMTGVNLIDIPNGKKDAADKAILADMFLFALDNSPPCTILLISGDVDFAPALHKLGQRGYSVVLAIPTGLNVSRALCNACTFLLKWPDVACGVGLTGEQRGLSHNHLTTTRIQCENVPKVSCMDEKHHCCSYPNPDIVCNPLHEHFPKGPAGIFEEHVKLPSGLLEDCMKIGRIKTGPSDLTLELLPVTSEGINHLVKSFTYVPLTTSLCTNTDVTCSKVIPCLGGRRTCDMPFTERFQNASLASKCIKSKHENARWNGKHLKQLRMDKIVMKKSQKWKKKAGDQTAKKRTTMKKKVTMTTNKKDATQKTICKHTATDCCTRGNNKIVPDPGPNYQKH